MGLSIPATRIARGDRPPVSRCMDPTRTTWMACSSDIAGRVEAVAGQTLDEAGVGLSHAVYRETVGNPFFVSEVLRQLAEIGGIYQYATGRRTSETTVELVAVPDNVREVEDKTPRRGRGARAVDRGGHRSALRPRTPGQSDKKHREG
jgi:hypothetical protein